MINIVSTNSVAINSIVAVITFIVALGMDFYVIQYFPPIIEAMSAEPIYYAIGYAAMIILMIGVTALAPYLAVVSIQKPE